MAHGCNANRPRFAFLCCACRQNRMQRAHIACCKPRKQRERQDARQGEQHKRASIAQSRLRKPACQRVRLIKAFRKLHANVFKPFDDGLHVEGKRHRRKHQHKGQRNAHAVRAAERRPDLGHERPQRGGDGDGQKRREQRQQNAAQHKSSPHIRMQAICNRRRHEHRALE